MVVFVTAQARLELTVAEAMQRHVATWDVREVCNWIQVIGMEQYRPKFMNQGYVRKHHNTTAA